MLGYPVSVLSGQVRWKGRWGLGGDNPSPSLALSELPATITQSWVWEGP